MTSSQGKFTEINDYGLIGNLKTAALISVYGAIDFMCLPDFDSNTVFGALLDQEKGGYFSIKPQIDDLRYRQLYLTDTAILVTRFFSGEGTGDLTDLMVIDEKEGRLKLLRKVTTVRGNITYKLECKPRFNNAAGKHSAKVEKNRVSFHSAQDQWLYLTGSQPMDIDDNDACCTFSLGANETAWFLLSDTSLEGEIKNDLQAYGLSCYATTFDYWKDWVDYSTFKGRWIETVLRSAITLKLLSSAEYGSVIAAPTFGLPESIGGNRNWDYRYCWIRDAAFTMRSFLKLGFMQEATAFMNWVEKYCTNSDLHLVYTFDGKKPPAEEDLSHMSGYMNSAPVRTGNNAADQTQLDIYGELMDAIYLYDKYGGAITNSFWEKLCTHMEFIGNHWRDPDQGIWEIRGEKKEFLYSRLMCWVAFDRAMRIADHRGFSFPQAEWDETRKQIAQSIYTDFWNEEKKSFVQYKGTDELDASSLLMPLVEFIATDDPKWQQTLQAIERDLKLDVLIYRYRAEQTDTDGLEGEEGTFTMCSFWYIECLAKAGRYKEASENFAKIIGYGNPLRLFSEQLSKKGDQVGNFPQALTHLALINAGIELNRQFELHNPHSNKTTIH